MKIESIELTTKEMHEAVQQYLHYNGLSVHVTELSSRGYPIKAWEIKCEPQEDVPLPIAINTVEDLTKAIEEGKV